MADLEDEINAANEILVVLSASDLISTFKDVENIYEKEDQIRRKNLRDAKEIIQDLQDDFAREDEKALGLGQDSHSQDVFQENMDIKLAEEKKIKEELKNLESEDKETESQLNEVKRKSEILEQRKKMIEEERAKILPENKSFFDLYLQTTGVHWDYNCTETDIKGFVAGKKDIKPFALNLTDHSKFYTVNYLWDLIDATQVE